MPEVTKEEPVLINGWYCQHQGAIAVAEKRDHWEQYCRANRRCEIKPDGCGPILLTLEFIRHYAGRIEGDYASYFQAS